MDNTHTWGSHVLGRRGFIAWRAEVAFRERTSNRKSLQHALRGILEKVGSIQEDVELEPVLAARQGHRTTVMSELTGA